jgi:hypothetical protein
MNHKIDIIKKWCKSNVITFKNIKKAKTINKICMLVNDNKISNYDNDEYYGYVGNYYKKQNDDENMIKYYLMAINKGNSNAMGNLGLYYDQILFNVIQSREFTWYV